MTALGATAITVLALLILWPRSPQHLSTSRWQGLVRRSQQAYTVPFGLNLLRNDGRSLTLSEVLGDGRPVVLTFLRDASDVSIPLLRQTLEAFAEALGSASHQVNIVAIATTPTALRADELAELARRTGRATALYTADRATSEAVLRAFDAWPSNDAERQPTYLLRGRPSDPWVRLDGAVSPGVLLAAYRAMSRAA